MVFCNFCKMYLKNGVEVLAFEVLETSVVLNCSLSNLFETTAIVDYDRNHFIQLTGYF